MREVFAEKIKRAIVADKNVILITADLGFSVFESIIEEHPKNYINVGVAEQNMIGIAAGLAMMGKRVFVYSITPFATSRCFEQIKVNLAYHNLNVTVVGSGSGFSYATSGSTHHSFEDIAIIRTLTNMSIYSPGDPLEVAACMKDILNKEGPSYLRLGKANEPTIHKKEPELDVLIPVREEDSEILLLATSNMLVTALEVHDQLKEEGICTDVSSIPILQPIDENELARRIKKYNYVITMEEHGLSGGLKSIIAELLADKKSELGHITMQGNYIKKPFIHEIGTQNYLRRKAEISSEQIAASVKGLLQ